MIGNSFVVITSEETYPYPFKRIYYSGEQMDDGTIAKKHVENLNRTKSGKYKAHVWDISNLAHISDMDPDVKQEIKMLLREYARN